MYIQAKLDCYNIDQLVGKKASKAWEKTVRPTMSRGPCPHPKEWSINSSTSLNALGDFDGMFDDKEYLTFSKGDTSVKLLKPGGIDAEGSTDGKDNEACGAGSMSESSNNGICGGTDYLLSEHELAHERLYRLWRAGWVRSEYVLLWAQSLKRLSLEGECDYLMWLLQRFPRLCENEEHGTNERSLQKDVNAKIT